MAIPRKIRKAALYVLLFGIPVLFLQANLKSERGANALDKVLLRISAPVQAAVTSVASAVHQHWRRYVHLIGVEEDAQRLERENWRLRQDLLEAQRRLRGLDNCRRLLAFRNDRGIETLGARVIGRLASPFVRGVRVRIDQGKEHVTTGLPVITADGVVGRISDVYGSYSDVQLAVDPRSAIDVIILRTGGRGVLRGIEGTNRYVARLDYVLKDKEVNVGDVVLTSGAGGMFPKDLPIGRVSAVATRSLGLYQQVEVTPNVDFSTLREMLVVLPSMPTESLTVRTSEAHAQRNVQ